MTVIDSLIINYVFYDKINKNSKNRKTFSFTNKGNRTFKQKSLNTFILSFNSEDLLSILAIIAPTFPIANE